MFLDRLEVTIGYIPTDYYQFYKSFSNFQNYEFLVILELPKQRHRLNYYTQWNFGNWIGHNSSTNSF